MEENRKEVKGNFQQVHHNTETSLNQTAKMKDRLERIEQNIEKLTGLFSSFANILKYQENKTQQKDKALDIIGSALTTIAKACNEFSIHRGGVRTDEDGDVVMISYDTSSNHLSSTNSFKGKDTDVERFVNMCEREFNFYVNFYSSEKKKVEFIESHLAPASDWYYMFLGESQKIKPDASLVFN